MTLQLVLLGFSSNASLGVTRVFIDALISTRLFSNASVSVTRVSSTAPVGITSVSSDAFTCIGVFALKKNQVNMRSAILWTPLLTLFAQMDMSAPKGPGFHCVGRGSKET